MSESATVTIERLVGGGDGIARHDGMAVFVPRALPGDVVAIALTRQRSFARGTVLELVTPSPDREPAPCPHYTNDRCGGCQVQGYRYDAQLAAKGALIRDALQRIGKRDVGDVSVVPSPNSWHYRNALTLTMQRDRMRPSGWTAGLHVAGDAMRIFNLETCLITVPEVMEGWHALMHVAEYLPRAATLRATVRRLQSGGLALTVEGGSQWKQPAIEAMVAGVPDLRAVWWVRDDGVRGIRHDRRQSREAGASFAQVNPPVAALLRDHVVAQVNALDPDAVVDGYAGSGALSALLRRAGRRIHAIELDAEATAVASAVLRDDPDARVLTGRVEDLLSHALPAQVVVLNPPRGGLDAAVPAMIAAAASGVQRLIYVSCDPATLARDIVRLGPGWRLTSVQGFDMFPQTAHVETVCVLDREVA